MQSFASRSPKQWLSARPEWPALLVIAVLAGFRLFGTVDPDVAWQLWIAHQVNHGGRLYRDMVEVNPPLWFWMALPVDGAASLTGARPESVLIAAIAALQMVSLLAFSRLLPGKGRQNAFLLAYTALALAGFAWLHAGQREQLVLIATLPYAALIAARRAGRQVAPALALVIGAAAALGFALKHYFLIVPLLLELWLAARQRRSWSALRPELAGLVIVGALYAVAILMFSADYLTRTLPLIRLAYGSTGAPAFVQLFQPGLVVGLAIMGLVAATGRHAGDQQGELVRALLVAALGFVLAFFIQRKGWPYQAIPLVGCGSVALAAQLALARQPGRVLRIAGPVLLALPLLLSWQEARTSRLPDADLKAAIAGVPPGTSIGFIATEPAFAWSVTLQHGFGYPSRYMGYWMMRSIIANERKDSPDPALTALGRRIARETVADFRCHPPARIIANRPTPAQAARGDFDLLAWLERDAGFAALMGHYRPVSRTSADSYVLARPLARLPETSCTRRF